MVTISIPEWVCWVLLFNLLAWLTLSIVQRFLDAWLTRLKIANEELFKKKFMGGQSGEKK